MGGGGGGKGNVKAQYAQDITGVRGTMKTDANTSTTCSWEWGRGNFSWLKECKESKYVC